MLLSVQLLYNFSKIADHWSVGCDHSDHRVLTVDWNGWCV